MVTVLDLPRSISVRAAAKITLHLGVGAVRDDGFHPLDTVYQAISLYDDVTLASAGTPSLALECADYIDASAIPMDESNIVFRSLELIRSRSGRGGTESIEILKSIPVAGGMAGGSADAAATLLAYDRLHDAGLPDAVLLEIAAPGRFLVHAAEMCLTAPDLRLPGGELQLARLHVLETGHRIL